jgi:NAD(P)-dependent dehydrogenase (short-subunit alcohol dehydrogenase family)
VTAAASAVVTGAGSGIGRAIAERLHRDGWAVVLVDLDHAAVHEATGALGGDATAVIGDVASPRTHQLALDAALALSPLGAWVNCAGVTRPCSLPALTAEEAAATIDVNLYGTLWGTQAAVTHWLTRTDGGALVNISSVHGRRAYPDHAVYEMTKAAIEALTQNVAVSHAADGIRANAVAPGGVRTPALEQSLSSAGDPAAALAELTDFIPTGRLAEPSEVAATVAFLLSQESAYLTGQTLVIDGAMTAHIGFATDPEAKRLS